MRSIDHLYNVTASISRPERTQTGAGFIETMTTVASDVQCRRSPMNATDQDYAASVQVVANHAIYFDAGTDVKRDDLIQINGIVYEARVVVTPSEPVYRKILAEEIQIGT